ncbi:MAG: DUF1549 and DUF1553 domain-containing protein, partial [Planctomycetales bacterium]
RLRCANCHNHPLDHWTQDDYHGLAAVFARIESGRMVTETGRGEVTHPRTGNPAVPRIPGERFLKTTEDPRRRFAEWMTSPDNPYFARAAVNRLWKAMMGRGLVEPTDDLRVTNPASHPELLDKLAGDFIQHGHDIRRTLRLIALSATYARSSQTADGAVIDDRFYSHALRRSLEPEVLADAVCDATGVPEKYLGQPQGTRAVELFDSLIPSPALDVLGRCSRKESCEEAGAGSAGLPTKLHLLNGDFINAKLNAPEGRLRQAIADGRSVAEIVDEFYYRCLGRSPRDEERVFWKRRLGQASEAKNREESLADFLLSLLNCREFVTNH